MLDGTKEEAHTALTFNSAAKSFFFLAAKYFIALALSLVFNSAV
jgi:hypothetical protein